ncbi:hypothetical protein QBC34DRAFT_92882 [Podospora aff. communis PSN243]|uniref:Uncharacterized protein n=1 Tax=Podospora aff. communis PSN243 TaxID=3040156 RepID=A0AAV9GL31_9PEZI|nr:hypothetical protein QBC34DRAFT_92882 [Podospora aff. communis PSN243]
MRHPNPALSGSRLCQLCEVVASRQSRLPTKRSFVTLQHASRHLTKPSQVNATWPVAPRLFANSASYLKVKRTPAVPPSQGQNSTIPSRFGRSTASLDADARATAQASSSRTDLAELSAAVDRVTKVFLAQPGIPSEEVTLTALRACGNRDISAAAFEVSEPPAEAPSTGSQSEASHLLSLDATRSTRRSGTAASSQAVAAAPPLRPQDVVDQISDAAYAIVTHPTVVITPDILAEYVRLQVQLGRPDSLPRAFELFASKPTPRLSGGNIQYSQRNPNKLESSINPAVADAALDAAIEARNLDVAVGIVESSYATEASRRLRLVKKALLPASAFGATPVAAYLLASHLSFMQDSMDQAMATNVAFVGILAYVGFTATIGVVAATTANDQMKRVTWAPGTPLKTRWLREDERAAYDKIACGFGFSEQHRYGEEQGDEFKLLREFCLRRGMILDAVELMPGMN